MGVLTNLSAQDRGDQLKNVDLIQILGRNFLQCGETLDTDVPPLHHAGEGSEQPELVKNVPAHCSELRLDNLYRSFSTQIML